MPVWKDQVLGFVPEADWLSIPFSPVRQNFAVKITVVSRVELRGAGIDAVPSPRASGGRGRGVRPCGDKGRDL